MGQFSPKKSREVIVQILFAMQVGGENQQELIELMMEQLSLTKVVMTSLYERASQIWAMRQQLDEMITKSSADYDLERIGHVERNILRQSIFELHDKSVEGPIVIAEANRLANKFCMPTACHFINAILDAIYQTSTV